jgi:hypothetical protein
VTGELTLTVPRPDFGTGSNPGVDCYAIDADTLVAALLRSKERAAESAERARRASR